MQVLSHITLQDLPGAAQQVIAAAGTRKIWLFNGAMGAGKTTLIKAICRSLDVTGELSSPTFSLVNEYRAGDGGIIYHFDFYRTRSVEEVYDIGYEDYFYSGRICLVEWPERISELLTEEMFRITIEKENDHSRVITLL